MERVPEIIVIYLLKYAFQSLMTHDRRILLFKWCERLNTIYSTGCVSFLPVHSAQETCQFSQTASYGQYLYALGNTFHLDAQQDVWYNRWT